ncbi:MAG: VanZ family protein [Bacteroidales bacterium]|nr:VanZ family protein [Bacteroidales bacterium]
MEYRQPVFWSYVIVLLLLVTLPLNTTSELNNITILQLRGDYFFHILMFLPWMFFRKALRIKPLLWLLIGLLFASATEGLQYLIPWRAFNVNDVLANVMGIILGFGLALFIGKIVRVFALKKS